MFSLVFKVNCKCNIIFAYFSLLVRVSLQSRLYKLKRILVKFKIFLHNHKNKLEILVFIVFKTIENYLVVKFQKFLFIFQKNLNSQKFCDQSQSEFRFSSSWKLKNLMGKICYFYLVFLCAYIVIFSERFCDLSQSNKCFLILIKNWRF